MASGIWGSKQVLDHLNVNATTLRYYRGLSKHQRFPGEPFPPPYADDINGGPIWLADDVIRWNERRRDNRRSTTAQSEPS